MSRIAYEQRKRSERASKHFAGLAETVTERTYESAISYAAPATPGPQPLLPLLPAAAGLPSPAEDPSLPAPTPRPAPNRLLVFDAPCDLPAAAAVEPAQEPSPPTADDFPSPLDSPPVPAQLPGSPRAMAQYADRDGPSFLHDKMNDWRQRCASPAVAEASDRYPTPPGAPDDDGLSSYSDSLCEGGRRYTANYKGPHTTTRLTSKHLLVRHRDRVWVRKDHSDPRGLAPLCYVATGYQGPRAPDGEHHHAYLCYDKKDIMWARRLRFHLGRFQP